MKAILRTACGCERAFEWNGRDGELKMALFKQPAYSWQEQNPVALDTAIEVLARRFQYRGKRAAGVPVFEEVEEVAASLPTNEKVVPFTTGEWADACARWSRISSGDLPQMDQEFLARHDGAEIICHNTGALIGAFYISPSWSNSNDAVQIFSALRQITENRGTDATETDTGQGIQPDSPGENQEPR